MVIEKIGERGLIHRIQERFPPQDRSIVIGIGDDAAIINPTPKKYLLFSTDTLREDIHFKKRYCTFYDIGWKAVAVSISDIAAMGGSPRYLLLSMALPIKTSGKDFDQLLDGVSDVTAMYDVSLVGGNLSRSKGGVTIDTTVIGELPRGCGLLRSGAGAGDLIYVTGIIGNSAIGLSLLKSSSGLNTTLRGSAISSISAHLHPAPRVREGIILGTNRLATAMIDISDGLIADLGHLCEQGNVGAHVYSHLIPFPQLPERFKKRIARAPLYYALYGGEDYELLFTVRRKDKGRLEAICKREGLNVTFIGEIVPREKGIRIVDKVGMERVIQPSGYDHFKKQRGKLC